MMDAIAAALSAKKVVVSAVASIGVGIVALSFTPESLTLLTTALGVLIGIIFAGAAQIIAARAAAKKLLAPLAEIVAPVVSTLKSIEHATNSATTKADEIIAQQKIQLDMQRTTITSFERQAALREQAAAIASAMPSAAAVPVAAPVALPAAVDHLQEIEVNTKETADTLKGTATALQDTADSLKDKA